MSQAVVNLLFLLVIIVGGIFLQIFLSKKKSPFLGLILPTITFLYSLLMVLGIAAFDGLTGEVAMLVIAVFIISNIPTIILMGIYVGCREKIKSESQVDKMKAQDLE